MTDIEKLVEECGEETCQIIGTLAGGCFSPEDVCDDTRCFCKTIGKSVAEELIRRTLEWAAGEATKFLVGDPKNGVPLRNPMPHEIAERLRSLASMENTRADT